MADPPSDHDWYEKSQRPQPNNFILIERIDYLRGDVKRIEVKIDNWDTKVIQIERDMAERCVTQDEFWPVKVIAYGFVGIILVAFMGLLIHQIGWKL